MNFEKYNDEFCNFFDEGGEMLVEIIDKKSSQKIIYGLIVAIDEYSITSESIEFSIDSGYISFEFGNDLNVNHSGDMFSLSNSNLKFVFTRLAN